MPSLSPSNREPHKGELIVHTQHLHSQKPFIIHYHFMHTTFDSTSMTRSHQPHLHSEGHLITVKLAGLQSMNVLVGHCETVADLLKRLGAPAESYVLHMACPLAPSYCLSALQPGSTVDVVLRLRGGNKTPSHCARDDCTDRPARIVGDCRYCSRSYCSRHRLPEDHACAKLANCRQQSYEKNSDKLLNGKCVADKM